MIATKLVKANECDTLLSICDTEVVLLNEVIEKKDSVIANDSKRFENYESILAVKDSQISDLQHIIKKDTRKKKWLKAGWISTSAVLVGLLTFSLVK